MTPSRIARAAILFPALLLVWLVLAAPRDCPGCQPFQLLGWEQVAQDTIAVTLLNPVESLDRPASLVEIFFGEKKVMVITVDPVGRGETVVFYIHDYNDAGINIQQPDGGGGVGPGILVVADGDPIGLVGPGAPSVSPMGPEPEGLNRRDDGPGRRVPASDPEPSRSSAPGRLR
jgi:hypothetical protein